MNTLLIEAESRAVCQPAARTRREGLGGGSHRSWAIDLDSDTDTVDVPLRRLHAKINDGFPTKLIHIVRDVGCVLESRP